MAVHLIQFLCLVAAFFPSLFCALLETTCSAPHHNDRIVCELDQLRLKISQLEAILEESTQNFNRKSLYLKEREEAIEALSRKIHHLQSTLESLKGESSRADARLNALEDEVRHLWAASRKNNFDIYNLESKARDAEERLQTVTSQVENMANIVTEQWIQIQRLEQALHMTKMRARRQAGPTRCTFLKFINNIIGTPHQKLSGLLDAHLFGKGPTLNSYVSQALHQLKKAFVAAKKYHHQVFTVSISLMQFNVSERNFSSTLQGLIKQELEKNEFTAALAHNELVFVLASALLTFPIMGAWMLLLS